MLRFDYNSISLFLFQQNHYFFNDATIHKIYEGKGAFIFIYNLSQIIYSFLISGFINGSITILSTTDLNIIELKNKSNKKNVYKMKKTLLNKVTIKIFYFFIISLKFLSAYLIYLTWFCYVYKNTQIHLIKDTCFNFGTSKIILFIIFILSGLFRLSALKTKKKRYDKECMVKLSKVSNYYKYI